MKVCILQHDHVSPPGPIAEHFAHLGYEVEEHRIVEAHMYDTPNVDFDFPDPSTYDVLVVMGAPWGAWDDNTIGRWLAPEMEWLRKADTEGVPVLGVCFGGQLLARTHGGSVARAPRPEIGWTAIWSQRPEIVGPGPWFEFHYDRWEVPPGAEEIARNSRASQAFILRRNLAVQFHPEVTAASFLGWLGNGGRALVEADEQDPDVLYQHTLAEQEAAAQRAYELVDSFLEHVAKVP